MAAFRDTLTRFENRLVPDVRTNVRRDPSTAGETISGVRGLQAGLGERLAELRSRRPEALATRVAPAMAESALRRGAIERGQTTMGSGAFQETAGAGIDEALAGQQIEAQELAGLLSTETGVQQLEQGFTAIFNQMASERFTRELQGLGAEVDKYMAEQGAGVNAERLAASARNASMAMLGRFAQAAGQSMKPQTTTTDGYTTYYDPSGRPGIPLSGFGL